MATPASLHYTRDTNATTHLPHTDDFTVPHHTSIRASDRMTAANLATTPLLPTKQLPATTCTPPHHTARTLLWVEDLVLGDNYLVDSGSKVSAVPPQEKDRKRQASIAYDLLTANKSPITTYGTSDPP
ncbi:hypothetical protein Pcinc_011238 [Petrolisthes cinctipes]|uniref:Uncharacterized protein n=1 Tax=Petrolisthes cinctipes TaxID=88211 RepID=A0AAE1FQG4_PETCI|nr:hypothetical protein Pcinc_021221 [Petrolisthes cinctipes]KAK3877756.1 hypothetical protein Pcinc_017568 [Petrolisthes cinctipes]KAK3884489.1 hypothetical protein Pcinc_011238 [Petrolisthes cinctipes]